MTDTRIRSLHEPLRRMLAVLMAVVVAGGLLLATAAPAQAAARMTASSSLGGAVASTSGPTTFTVSGSGFQSIPGGFGGIYVGFGWVNGSNWGPSKGGSTGNSYDYVPDDQSANNKGYQVFVAYPGSETAGEAKGTISASGSFSVQLTVPGPTFTGAGGKRIDCREVTCGFLSWGAHGVRNGSNETFTAVTFQGGAAPAPAAPTSAAPAAGGTATAGGTAGRAAENGRAAAAGGRAQTATQAQGAAPAAAQPGAAVQSAEAAPGGGDGATPIDAPADATGGTTLSGAAVIEVDRKSARAGGAMGFAAAGFWPGEQVYVVLSDGIAAVGPVMAGVDGEVAGVIVLPDDLEPGTHEIRAAGAGSGLEAVERFPLRVDIAQASSSTALRDSMKWVFLALAALALLATGAFVVKRRQDSAGDGHPDVEADAEPSEGYGDGSYPEDSYPTPMMQDEVQR